MEIAVFPLHAGLDAFDWRISMATVASDGPFSGFPGVDRTLSILSGEGMTLAIEGHAPITLTQKSAPHAFPADQPTFASLVAGPITDLNVMTRRGRFSHTVRRMESLERLAPSPSLRLLICNNGKLELTENGVRLELGNLDCLLVEPEDRNIPELTGKADIFLIELTALQPMRS